MRSPSYARLLAALVLLPLAWQADSRAVPEPPEVVVDYSLVSDSYRVIGDAALLSRRYPPGHTFQLIIGAVALESGILTGSMEIPCRANGGDSARTIPLTLARALQESNVDFFSQVARRVGFEPIRKFLIKSNYTSPLPEAVGSFGDLARGELLRVTVFEQSLFLQAFARRSLPLRRETWTALEGWLQVEAAKPVWGKAGTGEVSPEPSSYVSWFNGVVRLRDGPHVITVAVLTPHPEPVALDRLRRYLSRSRR